MHAAATGLRWRWASPRAAAIAGAVALVLTLATIATSILVARATSSGPSGVAFFLVFALAFAGVGVVVARREPRNPIGWLLLGASLAMSAGNAGPEYAYLDYTVHHGRLPLGALGLLLSQAWVYAFMLLPLIILFFPDGRLGPRWRWPLRAYLWRSPSTSPARCRSPSWPSACATPGQRWQHRRLQPSARERRLGGAGSGRHHRVLRPVLRRGRREPRARFRRATGERRQQLKWLGAGGGIAIATLLVTIVWSSAPGFVGNVLLPIALIAVPVSIGVGILKYRLYEIDRLVSRTLAYAILTALLVGTFIGLVALSTDALALSGRVGVAASTLAAAALFNPLRIRIQRVVDRRFNRARYDAQSTVAAFTARLRDAVEIDAIRADLLDAVNGAVEPIHASVWIRQQRG